jgi:hypothetical protein
VTTWLVAWVLEVAFEARGFEVEVARLERIGISGD